MLTQNPRRLPGRSQDAKLNGALVLDDTYAYDPNGNVLSIADAAQAGKTNRTMGYDALDRLISANSPQQWNTASYAYDPLDNLRIADQGTRQYRYTYDAISNRLNTITNPAGATQITLGYDVRGNVTGKTTSAGTQVLAFDSGNRLSYVAGQEYYRYDGQGRRVQSWTAPAGGNNLFVYSQGGQLLYTFDERRSRHTTAIYLGNTLLAQRHLPFGGGAAAVSYQHTDALGSVVAETDSAGTVTRRNAYAPYGEEYTTGTKVIDGQGYTGHVMDLATGFTYMQQRYYDPGIGRFLSVDPMASDMNSGWNFNRYNYAANNPYRFTDPDGRSIYTKGAKLLKAVVKGEDMAETFADNINDARTLASPLASPLEKGIAAVSLLSELLPASVSDAKDVGRLAGFLKRGPKTDIGAPHNATIRSEAQRLRDGGNTIIAGGGGKEKLIPTP